MLNAKGYRMCSYTYVLTQRVHLLLRGFLKDSSYVYSKATVSTFNYPNAQFLHNANS